MKKIILILCWLYSLTSWAIMSNTQTYKYNVFKSEQGLAQNYVYSIVQGQKGYLWIGTGEGISRYDGKDIKTFTTKDGLAEDFITSIGILDNGNVIFGHFEGGVSLYNSETNRFRMIDTSKIQSKVIDFATYKNFAYGLTSNTGIFLFDGKSIKLQNTPELQGRIGHNIIQLNNQVFVATNEGLIEYQIQKDFSLKFIKEFTQFEYISISALTLKPNKNGFWIGTEEEGIFEYVIDKNGNGKILDHPTPKIISNFEIHEILEDNLGNLWIGTKLHGIYRLEYSNTNEIKYVDIFTEETGYQSNLVNTLFQDKEGSIWAGTYGQGLIQMIAKEFVFFDFNKKFKEVSTINSLVETHDSTFFYGTNAGLYRGKINYHDTMYVFQKVKNFPSIEIECLYINDKDSILWIGTKESGLYYFNVNTNVCKPLNVLDILPNDRVRVITKGANNSLWLSVATKGVFNIQKNGAIISHHDTRNGFLHNDIFDILLDKKGRVWFATHASGLAYLKNNKLELLSQKRIFPFHDVNSITEDSQGKIWIATEGGGVFYYDEKTFKNYSNYNGLLSNYCYSILADSENNIWVGHRDGMSKIYTNQDSIVTFSEKDGLEATECLAQAICKDHRGHIWFGHPKGITKHDFNVEHHQEKAFPTYITNILLFSKRENLALYPTIQQERDGILQDFIEFPHKKNHFTFDFISVSLKKQNGITYQYMLEGYDTKWQTETKNNMANYTNLDPGTYTFKVRSSENGKHWTEVVSYNFVITPPFWDRWWFFAAQILFLVVIIFSVNRYSKSAQNKNLMRYLTFASVFIIFKFINILIEPLFRDFTGGIPIVKVFFNLVIAFCLLPVENLIRRFAWANRNV